MRGRKGLSWNITDLGEPKTCPCSTLYTTCDTGTGLAFNQDLCGNRPRTNRLEDGAAQV